MCHGGLVFLFVFGTLLGPHLPPAEGGRLRSPSKKALASHFTRPATSGLLLGSFWASLALFWHTFGCLLLAWGGFELPMAFFWMPFDGLGCLWAPSGVFLRPWGCREGLGAHFVMFFMLFVNFNVFLE